MRMFRPACSASLIALSVAMLPTVAMAQTVPDPAPSSPVEPTPTPTDEEEEPSSTVLSAEPETVENDIVVTGSRIRRPDFDTAAPVVSIGVDQIEQAGTTNLTDFLTGYPALQGSFTSADNSGNDASIGWTGLNLLNLRNLGYERTLVLVDGRRHVAGLPGTQAIDINTIPSDLIERVDILTGGASAIYGADGVSGVVNFVLKRNFEGLTARVQTGTTKYLDADQRLFSVTAGHNFADGRGNVAIAYEHGEEDRLNYSDRRGLRGSNAIGFYLNPDDPENFSGYTGGADNGIPDYVPLSNVRYFDTNREGGIDIDFDGFPDYFVGAGGNLVPYEPGNFVPDFFQQGGNGTLVSDYSGDLLPRIRRDVVNVLARFEISPSLEVFAEGKLAKNNSFSISQPTFDYYLYIPPDNPFISEELALLAPDGVLVNRDNFDLGERGEIIDRKTWRGVIGLRGELATDHNYEVSYVYGRSSVRNRYQANRIEDRFLAAIDVISDPVTGQPTCRVNVDPESAEAITFEPGQCVPLNLFGEGAPSQAAIDFITADTADRSRIKQQVVSGSLSGNFGSLFTFPGGGEVGYAVGAEYRKEASRFTPDELAAQGLTFGNALAVEKGDFNVKEVFAETRLPLFTRLPFAHKLEIGGAVRLSDYSTIGSTTAWKADALYAPVRDITLTGTYSKAVRAPNIGELFSGDSQTFQFITDPCNINQIQNGSPNRAANCAALLAAAGADPTDYRDFRSTNISGVLGSNPDLSEESAKTWTIGAILQPRFIPGLTARVDWYDIKLKSAINTASPEELAELCVDQPTLDNPYCPLIVRQVGEDGDAEAGNIIDFTQRPFNVASFETAGLDVNLNYRLRTANVGNFSFNVVGNYLKKLQFIGVPGGPLDDDRGEAFAPKYTVNSDLTWNMGRVTLNYGLLWFSKTIRGGFSNQELETNPDILADEYKYSKARWQHDIFASLDVGDQPRRLELFMGVTNLFNQKPEIGTNTYPVSSVGRFFFGGARVKLDKLF